MVDYTWLYDLSVSVRDLFIKYSEILKEDIYDGTKCYEEDGTHVEISFYGMVYKFNDGVIHFDYDNDMILFPGKTSIDIKRVAFVLNSISDFFKAKIHRVESRVNNGFVYKITNKKDGKIYIGKTSNLFTLRWTNHINYGKGKMKNIFLENDYIDFIFEVIEEVNIHELHNRERYWISFYDSVKNGYNSN